MKQQLTNKFILERTMIYTQQQLENCPFCPGCWLWLKRCFPAFHSSKTAQFYINSNAIQYIFTSYCVYLCI